MGREPFMLPNRPEDSEDDDDALSLSDFPLATTVHPHDDSNRLRRSSSEPPDLFEFLLIDLGSHMRSADDLIVSGKLVPLHDQCRRCESLSELERSSVSRSSSSREAAATATAKAQLARSSRSLDYRRLRRPPSSSLAREAAGRTTSSSSGGSVVARSDSFAKRPSSRPLWRVLPFGAVKLPAEMELREMRSRQLRRTPSTLFGPPAPAPAAVDRGGWKGPWRLIRALSCKDPASVAVATSLACLPHV